MGTQHETVPPHFSYRRAHLRLAFSALVGICVALLVPNTDWATRGLIGWDVAVVVFLAGTWRMAGKTISELKRSAAQQDENAPVILGVMLAAVGASLGGVLAEIHNARHASGAGAALFAILAIGTLVLSWLCLHVLFATHYAHRYYGDRGGEEPGRRGLIFPDPDETPDYIEFIYFAFCIGMTYQVSDVTTGTPAFRRLITFHGAFSFFYNTFVLALAVNLLSGLPSSS